AVGRYIRYSIIPYPLSAQHSVPFHFQDRVVSSVVAGTVILAMAGVLWILRKRIPHGFIWFGVFVGTLLPVLYFQGSGIIFAERYAYIPSFAFVILLAMLFSEVFPKKAGLAVLGTLAVVFFTLTVIRNRDWRNDETLYRRTLDVDAESAKFWN